MDGLLEQVTWKECLSNNAAWDTLTWFAALIGMASYLNKYGFIKWFSGKVSRELPTPVNFKAHRHGPAVPALPDAMCRESVRSTNCFLLLLYSLASGHQ